MRCVLSSPRSRRGSQPADAHRLLEERSRYPLDLHPQDDLAPTILLAERDPYAAEVAEYFLRTEGYAVRRALTANEAHEVLDEEPLSLAVIDLLISGGAGAELCTAAHLQRLLPVVAVSALDSRELAMQSAADAFLLKPLDSLQLISTVRDLLGTSAYLRVGVHVRE